MGRLIEQQAVIDCLTNTAKYFDMPQADEWTKGIHYGLIHGLDNILDNVPTVEAIPTPEVRKILRDCADEVSDKILDIVKKEYIPKADYETRLKADMVAMLEEIKTGINYEFHDDGGYYADKDEVDIYIQQKINSLKENTDGN